MREVFLRYRDADSPRRFGPIDAEERRRADLFFADLMGLRPARRRRWQPRRGEDGEAWAESGPLIEGPLTESEWRSVLRMLKAGEADVGSRFTDDAARNALLVAARIFCDRNALKLNGEDPLLCLRTDVTMGDRRVRALVPHVTARGPIIHLAGLMRSAGITVNEDPGWRTRAARSENGAFDPVGVMMHHTGGNGAGDLAGVVAGIKAHFYVHRTGVLTMVTAGRANHAGRGAQEVLDEVRRGVAPADTALRRGLRDALVGNAHFYGFENENMGTGRQPWPAEQIETMLAGATALCRRHGWTANRVVSHAEWTSRKVDPLGVDMNTFRASVAARLAARP